MSRYYRSILAAQQTYEYLVDVYPLHYAWSLNRKLSSSSTSPFRVRRSSDNAEYDAEYIGNFVNITNLISFMGSDDLFMTTIKNQGFGGSGDFTQTTLAKQPKIANAGVLSTDANGKLKLVFDGVDDSMVTGGIISESTISLWGFHSVPSDYFSFIRSVGAASWSYRFQSVSVVDSDVFDINLVSVTASATSTPRTLGHKLLVGRYTKNTTGGIKQYINGAEVASSNTPNNNFRTTGLQPITIGLSAGLVGIPMDFQESILSLALSMESVYPDIQSNINEYYGIY